MENEILTGVWQSLNSLLNWGIIVLVWATGYGVQFFEKIKHISLTVRVFVPSLVLTVVYIFATKINIGTAIVSFVFAFGFHTLFIKWIDRKFSNEK